MGLKVKMMTTFQANTAHTDFPASSLTLAVTQVFTVAPSTVKSVPSLNINTLEIEKSRCLHLCKVRTVFQILLYQNYDLWARYQKMTENGRKNRGGINY